MYFMWCTRTHELSVVLSNLRDKVIVSKILWNGNGLVSIHVVVYIILKYLCLSNIRLFLLIVLSEFGHM